MPESLPEGHFRTGRGGADRPARLGWSARLWRLRHGPAAASRDQTLRTSSQRGQAVDNHLRYQADSRCRASRDGSRHCDLDVRLETVTRDVTSCGTRVRAIAAFSAAVALDRADNSSAQVQKANSVLDGMHACETNWQNLTGAPGRPAFE